MNQESSCAHTTFCLFNLAKAIYSFGVFFFIKKNIKIKEVQKVLRFRFAEENKSQQKIGPE